MFKPPFQKDTSKNSHQPGLLRHLIEVARNKYVAKRLTGEVSINVVIGPINGGLTCEITETTSEIEVSPCDHDVTEAIKAMDMILRDLEEKASEFRGVSYAGDISVTGGLSVCVGPVEIDFNFSVGVGSLLALSS